jgi:integrase
MTRLSEAAPLPALAAAPPGTLDPLHEHRWERIAELLAAGDPVSLRTALGYDWVYGKGVERIEAMGGDPFTPDAWAACAYTMAAHGYVYGSIAPVMCAASWKHQLQQGDIAFAGRAVARQMTKTGVGDEERAPVWPRAAIAQVIRHGLAAGDVRGRRDAGLVAVAAGGALRLGEALTVRLSHLDLDRPRPRLAVPKKGPRGEFRFVDLNLEQLGYSGGDLAEWADQLAAAHAAGGVDDGPLFPSLRQLDGTYPLDERLVSTSTAVVVINIRVGEAGLPPMLTGHTFRRSAASWAHAEGWTPQAIRDLLAHTRMETTDRYIDELAFTDPGLLIAPALPAGWEPDPLPSARRAARTEIDWGAINYEETVGAALEVAADATRHADSTVKKYRNHAAGFRDWCTEDGVDPDRPLPGDVAWWLVEQADSGLATSTVAHRLRGLEWGFGAKAMPPDPTLTGLARQVLMGLKRADSSGLAPKRGTARCGDVEAFIEALADSGRDWTLAASVLLRSHTRASAALKGLDPRADIDIAADDVTVRWPDGTTTTAPTQPDAPFACPAWAAARLQNRASNSKTQFTKTNRDNLQAMARLVTGQRVSEPTEMTPEEWAAFTDQCGIFERIRRQTQLFAVMVSCSPRRTHSGWAALRWEDVTVAPDGAVDGFEELPGLLSVADALTGLAAVWPWPGDGTFGCAGPVFATMHPRDWPADRTEPAAAPTTRTLHHRLRVSTERLGFEPLVPSDLEATAAVALWHSTGDLRRVQKFLDHGSPDTTVRFLRERRVEVAA